MAVQRFSRLAVKTTEVNGTIEISLGNFYDQAWLMMRSSRKPVMHDGGIITQVSTDLYLIQAKKSQIVIGFEE
jgi:hypothetical protein